MVSFGSSAAAAAAAMAETDIGSGTGKAKRRKSGRRRKRRPDSDSDSDSDSSTHPLVVLGPDVVLRILGFLDARSVARSVLVSRAWQALASSDHLWKPKCDELWKGKAHIPHSSMLRGVTKFEAYSLSMKDGKRVRIMKEDLCDHVWEFRFNKTAPGYWLNLDPSWKDTGPPMRRYFHSNGSQTADPTDRVWGGHECQYSIVTSFVGNGYIREHYVRINRWPQMSVSRKKDWSWEMTNNLYSYTSIPDAEKEGGTGPLFPFW